MDYDIRTYFDAAGVERWVDDNKAIDQRTVFRTAYSGTPINISDMVKSHINSTTTSRTVARAMAQGRNVGKINGISRKADETMLETSRPDVFALAGAKAK